LADESRNPADNYEFRRLRSELQSVVDELKAEAQLARDQQAEATRATKRQSETAAAESRSRRTRTAGQVERLAAQPLPREETADLRGAANEAERLARARERGLRAAQQTAQAVERERLALPPGRQPRLLGPGAPQTTLYEPPIARPIPGTGGPGAGGGGRIPPVLPPAGGGGAGGFDENARRRAADATGKAADAEARYRGSMNDTVRAGAAYDDSLRRHGALTTEFFSALARGEVTLAELRFQLGATIAKFGGWTLAATATFAVIGALGQLGRGAMDASSGVSQIQRYIDHLDTAKAQQQLIDLSQHFNLPIHDVADAMAQMGQVFKDQDQAFHAAEAALYGVRTGNLSVADSVKYLNAIARSSGVQSGEELTRIFDRFNQAQNHFGVGIRDNMAGVAKAEGAWRQAGGSIEYLQTLITTAGARSGRSGEQLGTAFQRAAEIIKRTGSKNKDELATFGIDASQPIDVIFKRATDLVRSGKVKGPDLNRLARALATPQLAPYIVPALADPKYQDRVGADLAKSRGSAERELNHLKQSAAERVKSIGNTLQQLGAEFVLAGGGHPFTDLLTALQTALTVTKELLQLFGALPAPLREAAIYGLELAALFKLGRRFGIGNVFTRTGSPEERAAQTRVVDFHRTNVAAANEQLARAQNEIAFQQQRVATTAPGTAERARADARLAAAELEAAEATDRLAFSQERLAAAERVRSGMDRGVVPPAGVPPYRPVGVPAGPGGVYGERAPGGPGFFGAPGRNAPEGGTGINLLPAAQRAEAEASRFRGITGKVAGATGRAFESMAAMGGLTGAAGRAMQRLGGLKAGLKQFGTMLRGLLSDPIGMGFVAFAVGSMIAEHFKARGREDDKLGSGPKSKAQADAVLTMSPDAKWYDAYVPGGSGVFDPAKVAAIKAEQDVRKIQARERAQGKPVTSLFTSEIRRQTADTLAALKVHTTTRKEAYEAVQKYLTELKSSRSSTPQIAAAKHDIEAALYSIGPNAHQSLADILGRLDTKQFIAAMQADAEVVTDYARRPQRLKEINTGYRIALEAVKRNPTAENVKKFKAAADAVDAVIADSQKRLDDQLAQAGGTLRQRESAYDANRARLLQLPASRARTRALTTNEQTRFQDEQQSFSAYTDYRASAIRDPTARDRYVLRRENINIRRLRDAVKKGRAKQEDLWQAIAQRNATLDQLSQDAFGQFDAYTDFRASGIRDPVARDQYVLGRMNQKIGRLRALVKAGKAKEQDLWAAEAQRNQQLDQLQQDQDAAFQSQLDASDAKYALQVHGDPVLTAQRAVQSAIAMRNRILSRAHTAQALNAADQKVYEAQLQSQQAQEQQALANFQSGQSLAASRFALAHGGAQGPTLRYAVGQAQRFLAFVQSRHHTQADLNAALQGVTDAQLALQQYIRQQVGAMIAANQAYAAAGIDPSNTVALARLEERTARRDRRRNPGQDPATRRQQDARVRQAHQDTMRARQQDRYDTIEFEASIGKITRQQEISQLQTLLATIHNNKALRRQIRQQIYNLKHQTDDTSLYDLNVGNIKLPTVYEIRRAMKGGYGPTQHQVQVQNNQRINVTVNSDADTDYFFQQLEDFSGAPLKAAGKSGGLF
jgi:hypothetical protein